ncbi:helix-turn-helix transcriptional regulator [Kineosporia sp. NBRC 101731]|uniref:helix-turn-helix transcriptional regulator n=1 Tax=Kineosporia sp. NBRC 101731 TaxID=3032199 RepID=UPI0024A2B2CC|nr:helix-turn-helix transcriptional regulator [Kineosporia sp. NBRC 101731]GLY33868.1 transcriptional regulator [Kineosporia sp. NBRC 101731]
MDKHEIREFLVTRRARVTPEQAGLPTFGGERRVPGLRREEVAMLAGVSVDYYTRLERGKLGGASESVIEAIARALQLDDAEREHLFDLARAVEATRSRRPHVRPQPVVRLSIQRVLDGMDVPAVVRNARLDLVSANEMGRALYAPHFDTDRTANIARFIFLDPRARDFYPEWEGAGEISASMLRIEAGRNPLDADLTALIGELSTLSLAFRELWARHNVHLHQTGSKHFRHPVVGELHLVFDALELPAERGLAIDTFSAESGSPSEDALRLLEAWTATRLTEHSTAWVAATNRADSPRGARPVTNDQD